MSIGAQLRQARLERKLSFADVSKVTKIQPWILEAIEEDRAQQAMSPVYAKGFINNYAKHLGLNLTALQAAAAPVVPQTIPAVAPAPLVEAAESAVAAEMAVAPARVVIPSPQPIASATDEPAVVAPKRIPGVKPAVAQPVMAQNAAPAVSAPARSTVGASARAAAARAVAASRKVPAKPRVEWRMPALPAMPRITLPQISMPSLRVPQVRVPWALLTRVGVVAATCALIVGVVAVNPLKHLPKVASNKRSQTKVASIAPLPVAAKLPAKSAQAPAASALKDVKPGVKEAREQESPKPVAPAKEAANKETKAKEAANKETKAKETAAAAKEKERKEVKPAAKETKEAVKETAKPAVQTAANQPIVPANKALELSISVKRNTWVQLWSDGKLLVQQRLRRGVQEKWTAQKRFELVVANPSQVELILNGTPITGAVMVNEGRLLITHKGVTKLVDTPS